MLSLRRVLSVLALAGLIATGFVVAAPVWSAPTASAATASVPWWWRWWQASAPSAPTTRPTTTRPTPTVPPTTTVAPTTTTVAPTPTTTAAPTTTVTTTTSAPPTTTRPTTTTTPPAVPPPPSSDVAAIEQRTLDLINAERAKVGCAADPSEPRLAVAARRHSEDMAANNYFSHTDLAGGSPSDRVKAQGYPSGAAEIIAAGYRTPEDAVVGWMNSPGHKAIITDCRYTQAGAGFARGGSYGYYWTVNFGQVRS